MANLAVSPAGARISSGRTGVAATAKLKFAFGLFADPGAMLSAARELSAWGIPSERMRLVVHPESGGLGAVAGRKGETVPARVIAATPATSSQAWIAPFLAEGDTEGGRNPASSSRSAAKDAAKCSNDSIARWAAERPARQLHEFVTGGGGLLVVRLASDAEHHVVCSTFLHHASQGVQTHEIRCPANGMT